MSNLDRMNARLEYLGGNAEARMRKDKLRTFEQSLSYSYQSSSIIKDGLEYKALINPNRLTMDFDDKLLSVSFDSGFKVGDTFYWDSTNTHWIVYTQQFSEDAYFRGSIRNCRYQLKWLDKFGNEQNSYAAVIGPKQTDISNSNVSNVSYDTPNYTLTVLLPSNELTKYTFVRYYKLMLEDKAWEIQAADYISMPGIIQLTLQEDYKNKDLDTSEVVGGKVVLNTTITSALDSASIPVGSPYELWTKILSGENVLTLNYTYRIISGNATLNDNKLLLNDEQPVTLELNVPDIKVIKQYVVTGVSTPVDSTVLNIIGPLMVKPYGSTTYTVNKYVNGIQTVPTGDWSITGTSCIIESKDATTLIVKWINTKKSVIKITYQDGIDTVEQDVTTQSLF